jgi:hypothetical protein
MLRVDPALSHHLFDITIRKLIKTAPSHAQEDDVWGVVPPFERSRATIYV